MDTAHTVSRTECKTMNNRQITQKSNNLFGGFDEKVYFCTCRTRETRQQ